MRGIRSKAQSRRQVGWGERPKNTKRFGPKIIWGPADRLPHESLSLPGISIFLKRLAFAKPAPIRGVHLQKADRRSAYRGAPDNKDSVALEVLIPLVPARMKEPDECAAFRVKSAQVRSLVRVAVVAGESEVSAVVSTAMLASDDVRRDRRRMAPRLAAGSSIRSDNRLVHGQFAGAARPSGGMTFSQESTSFGLQNGDEIPDTDHCLILVALLWCEPSFGAFVGQFLDPPLHLRVGT
jgi:hypothetical protein